MIDASKKGHTDIVKRLIKENVDVNKKDSYVRYMIILIEYIFILKNCIYNYTISNIYFYIIL